ncbi:hypothetical protein M7I_0713 [Glarea lozoyensis 74030]|uniref:Uncharacterized protein n=1 Tax=Glarea lozoyensis (strain ATCC 74030 / MF5533) TaxID=1104152 RepID=H0EE42_GLAL7|nr:hypothetical protein M7I_0713 [Glarea lozoyensis 74030]
MAAAKKASTVVDLTPSHKIAVNVICKKVPDRTEEFKRKIQVLRKMQFDKRQKKLQESAECQKVEKSDAAQVAVSESLNQLPLNETHKDLVKPPTISHILTSISSSRTIQMEADRKRKALETFRRNQRIKAMSKLEDSKVSARYDYSSDALRKRHWPRRCMGSKLI